MALHHQVLRSCLDGHRGNGRALELEGMQEAFLSSADEDLPERLLRTLERGQLEGGDRRGRQSASLLVAHEEAYPLVDLRVDEHPTRSRSCAGSGRWRDAS
jgi:uncharacterized Ntn-hydrolase superfamily protein